MSITPETVRHIAKLARLNIPEEELKKYASELSGIFGVIEKLSEVDTKGVEPTAQVTGLQNVLREDKVDPKNENPGVAPSERSRVKASATPPDALLACSPLPIYAHQIETPSAHGN